MTSQFCTLYLVRHGQTQWNVESRIQGQLDIPLTKIGENQAHEQGENLKKIHFDKIYSSDFIRAKRTAELLSLERNLAVETTKLLRERYFGSYQGKSMEEGKKVKLWDLLDKYKAHPHVVETKVETNEQMIGRTLTFLREISVAHPGGTILVVSHGGLMRLLLTHLGYPNDNSFSIQNLAYVKLECDGVDFEIKETFGIIKKPFIS